MGTAKIGDIVVRESYGRDILFKVTDIEKTDLGDKVILVGIYDRIRADAPACDLVILSEKTIVEHKERIKDIIENKTREIALSGHYRKE